MSKGAEKPRFGLDVDGCLYSWDGTIRFLMEHHFGYKLEKATSWDEYESKVSKKHWNWLWDSAAKNGLFRHGSLYRGAIEFVNSLSRMCDIVIITKRPADVAQDTFDWLAFHRIPTREVHIIEGPKSQVRHCDFYLDDSGNNVEDLVTNVPAAFTMLMDRSWNQDCQKGVRVWSFAEVLEEVDYEICLRKDEEAVLARLQKEVH